MKSKQKRGADRLVRRMAKGVRPARMEVDCSGGELSSNGGSALLLMLAEQVRLFERVSECFTDHRDPSKVAHPLALISHNGWLGCDVCACKLLIPRSWLGFAGGRGW